MHRVVIHLCSPLLCQTSWLQRQLLKDGIILRTIFVGIVSVQHQVLTISLSHGIVTMPELVYRMLVTLLYVSKQWGFGESPYVEPTTYTYPLAYSVNVLNVVIGSVGGRESTCRIDSVSHDSFVAYRHFSGSGKGSGYLYWLAIGV